MLFRKENDTENGVWIDREMDGRLDRFSLCEPCNSELVKNDPVGNRWHQSEELCPSCRSGFEAHALSVDLLGIDRPFNGMLEDRLLTNDELEEELPAPISGALDYFLQDKSEPSLPGVGAPELLYLDEYLPPDYM